MEMPLKRGIRQELLNGEPLPFIGVYDVFSALIAAKHYKGIFISGFGFAASHYGLPDIGFIAWPDIVAFVQRVRTVLPDPLILVDIDDGYVDTEVACHVVAQLEAAGASGVVIEDQRRPRRCGHFEGKQLMELDDYVAKLKAVLSTRKEMFVVARSDAAELDDIERRVEAFAEAGSDAILVDGLRDLSVIKTLQKRFKQPFVFNQIAGGKSPRCNLQELKEAGASMVIYSTPCLFAAQDAMEDAMRFMTENDGLLPTAERGRADVKSCTALLGESLTRRGGR
jgi:2-methylisocitrate lyase-like PEP mutase family enzyme